MLLKEIKERCGVTQRGIAKELNISYQGVGHFLCRKVPLSYKHYATLSKILKIRNTFATANEVKEIVKCFRFIRNKAKRKRVLSLARSLQDI